MSRDLPHLVDILISAKRAVSYLNGLSEDDFSVNHSIQDAVIRRVSIIGEAAKRLSSDATKNYPELPLSDMIGMRNVLVHDYDGVDLPRVWDTIKIDLPPLISYLESIIPSDALPRED